MKDNQKGHPFGQYVRVSKNILNKASDIEGRVGSDLVGRIISDPVNGEQKFVLVAFPKDNRSFFADLIGYIGQAKTEKLRTVDDYITVQDFSLMIAEQSK